MQGTMPGACRRGRIRTAWMDIKTWTGLPVEESVRITEINGESTSMVWPTVGSRSSKEQNRISSKQLIVIADVCSSLQCQLSIVTLDMLTVGGISRVRRTNEVKPHRAWLVLGWVTIFRRFTILVCNKPTRSTQPCIPLGSLNQLPTSAGVKAGMSPLLGGR